MSLFARYRLKNELATISLPLNTELQEIDEFKLEYSIQSPSNLYKNKYTFAINIPRDYPFDSPKVHCLDKIFHPNIDEDGNVCLEFLRHNWTSAMGISWIIYGIYLFFADPEGKDALNIKAGDLLLKNKESFEKIVREYENERFNK
ncbi:hypothetical protein H312_00934 [Anncaliia algerae PRA339]|uniref:UBC core domain-containing protein n=1 Tax=Anncaliia algerae PRA339 TaxID=1288291 RepID=A0A059F355_9MICR|nr:hypothetical protein H312_00934 [Anncaliia algerae PRA339]